ncbi:MAG: hypothetical protein ACP5FK_11350 [bacterium]
MFRKSPKRESAGLNADVSLLEKALFSSFSSKSLINIILFNMHMCAMPMGMWN